MPKIEELVRRVQHELAGRPAAEIDAAVSEVYRREAHKAVSGMLPVATEHQVVIGRPVMYDALVRTEKGSAMVVQVLGSDDRICELFQTVHSFFPYRIFKAADRNMRKIGRQGGEAYKEAMTAVFHATKSEADWDYAINLLTR